VNAPLVVDLADAAATPGADLVGTKVARLLEARQLGCEIAPGFVVTAPAVRRIDGRGDWPPELEAAVERHYATLAGKPLVVRTSAVAEDLPEASFAGQYESVLDVRELAELKAAIETCRASVDAPRVRAYREARGAPRMPAAAVAVVEQISADVAGVAFSVDPVKGSADRVVLEIGAGNPSSVSAGRGKPIAVEYDKQAGRVLTAAPAGTTIAPEEVRSVVTRVIELERGFGHPIDVEWGLVRERGGARFFLFQVRPVTALPPGPPEWDLEHYARRFADL
jgi:phosphoenolpyruvate synthase/pyruvate phosphate dikinase